MSRRALHEQSHGQLCFHSITPPGGVMGSPQLAEPWLPLLLWVLMYLLPQAFSWLGLRTG